MKMLNLTAVSKKLPKVNVVHNAKEKCNINK